MATATNYFVDPGAGNDGSGDGAIGTPWASVQHALDNITRDTTNGDRINLKAGTANVCSGALDFSTYGNPAAAAPFIFSGYTSALNDHGLGDLDMGANGLLGNGEDYISFIDMELHNFGSNRILDSGSTYINFDNCLIHDVADSFSSSPLIYASNGIISSTHFYDLTTGSPDIIRAAGCFITGCFISYDGTGDAIEMSTDGSALSNVIKINNVSANFGINADAYRTKILGNSIYSSVACTGSGINANGTVALYENNIVEGFSGTGGKGITATAADGEQNIIRNNKAFNNSTDFNITHYAISENNATLDASPFNDPSSNDFTVDTTVKAAGSPSYVGGRHYTPTATFIDVGAAQRQEPSSGGTAANLGVIHAS